MSNFTKRAGKILKNPNYVLWKIQTQYTVLRKKIFFIKRASNTEKKQSRSVMFHLGRSGSTLMADMLNQNPSIYWGGEIAKPLISKAIPFDISPLQHFDHLLEKELSKSSRFPFYGFEIKPYHVKALKISWSDFLHYLREKDFSKFIILERKNYLRKIVSSVIASQYGAWHQPSSVKSKAKKVLLDISSVRIDGEEKTLLNFLESYENELKSLRNSLNGLEVVEISYEDEILASPENAAKKCCHFLGVDVGSLSVRYGRTNPQSLSDLVVNMEQVRDELTGTRFEWMLKD